MVAPAVFDIFDIFYRKTNPESIQNRTIGPNVSRRLLCAPLLK